MAFTLPDDLAPEIYPLAWLIGTWRGYGILTYGETVPEQAVAQQMVFDHDGGPYLRQRTTVWTVDADRSRDLDFETPGLEGFSRLAPARVWSAETAYWRPVGREEADADGADGGLDAASSRSPDVPVTSLELVSADPAGHVAVWEGWIQGPRAQVGTQAVGRTRTAAALTEMTRMFGLVGGDLMWTQDMAAFGVEELGSDAYIYGELVGAGSRAPTSRLTTRARPCAQPSPPTRLTVRPGPGPRGGPDAAVPAPEPPGRGSQRRRRS